MRKITFLLSIIIFTLLFLLSATKHNALAASCDIDHLIINGVNVPFQLGYVPAGVPFNINLNCAPGGKYEVEMLTSPTGDIPWNVFPGGSGSSGTGTGSYGPFGPLTDSGIVPAYKLFVYESGTVQTCNPANCQFRSTSTGYTIPTPIPETPQPGSIACPPSSGTFSGTFRYAPDPPELNKPFQVQFNVPTNGTNVGMLHFKLTDDVAQKTIDIPVVDASSSYGIWYAPIPALNNQASWQMFSDVLADGSQTCSNGTFFNGIGMGSPSGLAAGRNPCDSTGCDTAIGKIPTNLGDFATAVLRIALGIAGGIVLILMTVGSIRVMTSSGDPQKAAAGREMITAALAGALFIAFSVMIMQFLGTAIVPIPGLTFNT